MISMWLLIVLIAMARASHNSIEEGIEHVLTRTVGNNANPSLSRLPNGYFFMMWELWECTPGCSSATIYGQTFLPNGAPFCDEFQINQPNDGYYAGASAAILDDKIFVVWSGGNTSNTSIYGRFFTFNGTALSDEFIVNSNTTGCHRSQPSVIALINGNALVVWYSNQTGDYDIYARLFFPNGTAIGDEFVINSYTTGDQRSASVFSLINGNVLVLWSDGRWGPRWLNVYGRLFFPNGTAIDDEFQLSPMYPAGYLISISAVNLIDENILVVWDGLIRPPGSGGIYDSYIHAALVSIDGRVLENENILNFRAGHSPSVLMLMNGRPFLLWVSEREGGGTSINGAIFSTDLAIQNEFVLNSIAGWMSSPKAAISTSEEIFVVWSGDPFDGNRNIYGRILDNQTIMRDETYSMESSSMESSSVAYEVVITILCFAIIALVMGLVVNKIRKSNVDIKNRGVIVESEKVIELNIIVAKV